MFDPHKNMLGGYGSNDGTIEFYGRINSILDQNFRVLDLGAGRASWYDDDPVEFRKHIRLLKYKVSEVVAADIDEAVLKNRASDVRCLLLDLRLPFDDNSFDLVIADYVLEHVSDPLLFAKEVDRVLKKGGYFCARTPHRYNYISIFSRLIRNKKHASFLEFAQPDRKSIDVFPTEYKMNTLKVINFLFRDYQNFSYVFSCEPSYYFGNRYLYYLESVMHKILPSVVSGNIFVFFRK